MCLSSDCCNVLPFPVWCCIKERLKGNKNVKTPKSEKAQTIMWLLIVS